MAKKPTKKLLEKLENEASDNIMRTVRNYYDMRKKFEKDAERKRPDPCPRCHGKEYYVVPCPGCWEPSLGPDNNKLHPGHVHHCNGQILKKCPECSNRPSDVLSPDEYIELLESTLSCLMDHANAEEKPCDSCWKMYKQLLIFRDEKAGGRYSMREEGK